MKINWKTRIRHRAFWVGLIGVVVSPVLAYNGASAGDITTWSDVGELLISTFSNPYLLGSIVFSLLGFLGVLTDPTTEGLTDSERAMNYIAPSTLPEDE